MARTKKTDKAQVVEHASKEDKVKQSKKHPKQQTSVNNKSEEVPRKKRKAAGFDDESTEKPKKRAAANSGDDSRSSGSTAIKKTKVPHSSDAPVFMEFVSLVNLDSDSSMYAKKFEEALALIKPQVKEGGKLQTMVDTLHASAKSVDCDKDLIDAAEARLRTYYLMRKIKPISDQVTRLSDCITFIDSFTSAIVDKPEGSLEDDQRMRQYAKMLSEHARIAEDQNNSCQVQTEQGKAINVPQRYNTNRPAPVKTRYQQKFNAAKKCLEAFLDQNVIGDFSLSERQSTFCKLFKEPQHLRNAYVMSILQTKVEKEGKRFDAELAFRTALDTWDALPVGQQVMWGHRLNQLRGGGDVDILSAFIDEVADELKTKQTVSKESLAGNEHTSTRPRLHNANRDDGVPNMAASNLQTKRGEIKDNRGVPETN